MVPFSSEAAEPRVSRLIVIPVACDGWNASARRKEFRMCRSIKTLHNFEPPATDQEIRASALQFVRKLSGFARPSQANQPAFDRAVDEVTRAAHELLASLVTNAPARDREVEAAKARARAAQRYGADAT
jgi:hypothetical protein